MTDTVSRLSIFLLWITALLSTSGCQSQPGITPEQPATATATPTAPVATPSATPVATPEPPLETGTAENQARAFSYELVSGFGGKESEELSDIAFYPPRETLFAVRDNGEMIEIKTDGTFIRDKKIRKDADLEGITYNPDTGKLYVVVEGEEIILEINPETLAIEQVLPIDRIFEGRLVLSPEGDGVEGIAYVPAADGTTNGTFYLVNQADELTGSDSSIVVEVEIRPSPTHPRAEIVRYFSVGITDLSGITYIPSDRRLLITSDAQDLLLETGLDGDIIDTYPLPGQNQEGITVDGEGSLYIAQDTEEAPLKLKLLPGATDR